jgi:hypothetical protein
MDDAVVSRVGIGASNAMRRDLDVYAVRSMERNAGDTFLGEYGPLPRCMAHLLHKQELWCPRMKRRNFDLDLSVSSS